MDLAILRVVLALHDVRDAVDLVARRGDPAAGVVGVLDVARGLGDAPEAPAIWRVVTSVRSLIPGANDFRRAVTIPVFGDGATGKVEPEARHDAVRKAPLDHVAGGVVREAM